MSKSQTEEELTWERKGTSRQGWWVGGLKRTGVEEGGKKIAKQLEKQDYQTKAVGQPIRSKPI